MLPLALALPMVFGGTILCNARFRLVPKDERKLAPDNKEFVTLEQRRFIEKTIETLGQKAGIEKGIIVSERSDRYLVKGHGDNIFSLRRGIHFNPILAQMPQGQQEFLLANAVTYIRNNDFLGVKLGVCLVWTVATIASFYLFSVVFRSPASIPHQLRNKQFFVGYLAYMAGLLASLGAAYILPHICSKERDSSIAFLFVRLKAKPELSISIRLSVIEISTFEMHLVCPIAKGPGDKLRFRRKAKIDSIS